MPRDDSDWAFIPRIKNGRQVLRRLSSEPVSWMLWSMSWLLALLSLKCNTLFHVVLSGPGPSTGWKVWFFECSSQYSYAPRVFEHHLQVRGNMLWITWEFVIFIDFGTIPSEQMILRKSTLGIGLEKDEKNMWTNRNLSWKPDHGMEEMLLGHIITG
jgi:hypothetical protein